MVVGNLSQQLHIIINNSILSNQKFQLFQTQTGQLTHKHEKQAIKGNWPNRHLRKFIYKLNIPRGPSKTHQKTITVICGDSFISYWNFLILHCVPGKKTLLVSVHYDGFSAPKLFCIRKKVDSERQVLVSLIYSMNQNF